MNGIFDKYTILARLFPAVLASLPVVALFYFLQQVEPVGGFLQYIQSLELIGAIPIYLVAVYFYALLMQNASKLLEKWYFHDRDGFPTTYLMLYSDDTFSESYKNRYRDKLVETLGVEPPSKEDEREDREQAKQHLSELTREVRIVVGPKRIVHNKNILYGSVRNFTAGSLAGVILSVINVVLDIAILQTGILAWTSIVLLLVYGLYILFHKWLLIQTAESYAKQLVSDFIAS